jgi:hypothetical protein
MYFFAILCIYVGALHILKKQQNFFNTGLAFGPILLDVDQVGIYELGFTAGRERNRDWRRPPCVHFS